ncbi:hypothetical protein M5K25_018517 [Dendrobium thyrsiflorum]|uniref:Uncharacterized protein n=1 Tax=Dendrobium thyrsiflorum TaxID=117978 RepID=A0ABD0UQR3_DENTH
MVESSGSTRQIQRAQDPRYDIIKTLKWPLKVELSVSELRTQRYQNQLNPSPNEFKSSTRSTVGRIKPQFGLPNNSMNLQAMGSHVRVPARVIREWGRSTESPPCLQLLMASFIIRFAQYFTLMELWIATN